MLDECDSFVRSDPFLACQFGGISVAIGHVDLPSEYENSRVVDESDAMLAAHQIKRA
jgi:hypothetical protein